MDCGDNSFFFGARWCDNLNFDSMFASGFLPLNHIDLAHIGFSLLGNQSISIVSMLFVAIRFYAAKRTAVKNKWNLEFHRITNHILYMYIYFLSSSFLSLFLFISLFIDLRFSFNTYICMIGSAAQNLPFYWFSAYKNIEQLTNALYFRFYEFFIRFVSDRCCCVRQPN